MDARWLAAGWCRAGAAAGSGSDAERARAGVAAVSWLALAMALLFWPPPMVAGGRLAVLGGAGRMRALPSWPGWRIAVPALPVGALVALAAIGTTVTLGPALGLAAGVTAATTAALARAAVGGRREREQRREALAAVRAMTAEAHAGGHAAALFGAGAGVAPLLADQLEAAAARAALGECAPEVLHAPPLVGMAHAWRVSHHTGIALADVFTRVSADLSAVQRRHAEVSAALAGPRASALLRRRSSTGITRSLLTIVDSATDDTITMPVAAEKPPM